VQAICSRRCFYSISACIIYCTIDGLCAAQLQGMRLLTGTSLLYCTMTDLLLQLLSCCAAGDPPPPAPPGPPGAPGVPGKQQLPYIAHPVTGGCEATPLQCFLPGLTFAENRACTLMLCTCLKRQQAPVCSSQVAVAKAQLLTCDCFAAAAPVCRSPRPPWSRWSTR
jgi:hypothetical protein